MECEGLRFFIYRDPRRAEGDSASDVLRFKRRSFSQHVLSDRQNAEENEDRRQCFSQISPTPPTDNNRCYIGYTVDPNRRIRQHNAGKQFGGAGRTDHRGPWDMVCIIHGFPNSVSALRFEWAWQNPDKSRRLRSLSLRKKQKESAFAFRFRIACHMLNSDPWRRLSLTFRWLLPSSEIAFPPELPLSPHMSVARGLVEKTSTLVPQLPEQYIYIRKCAICSQTISKISELVRCTAQQQSCGSHFHMRCLSKTVLAASNELHAQLFPISGKCPKCDATFIWGDLIRDQRLLLSIDKAKPIFINEEHAVSKVPAGKLLKI
ncbi:unnamed protein product [Toxocara canis]|uniref:Structure-specific endonuclease subunit SLX1 homolog n=1 Tax=Toxocara canis TaxID=6265 RepID=A0A183UI36_TOXCA|nr:unnamed protein product [Toxocara canis]